MLAREIHQFKRNFAMNIAPFARLLKHSLLALLLAGSTGLLAQAGRSLNSSNNSELSSAQGLVNAVRESTAKFQDVNAAIHAQYTLTFGCVTGPDAGAMGLHYVNFNIL